MNNKLVIAAAGSGKTTFLVNEALKIKKERVLITTYTQANENEIRRKIIAINKCIPENITIQTWFSFLLQHGVRPYQRYLFDKKITGLLLVNSQSGEKYMTKNGPVYFSEEKEFEQHYFTTSLKIYSDKLAKFVCKCETQSAGAVIRRIAEIYPHLFIDEVQDLAGYDLEILKFLFNSSSNILLVGDPRQGTYSTNTASKNKQYRKSQITNFFDDKISNLSKDDKSLLINYRSILTICNLSNKLYPLLQKTESGNNVKTDHDGIFWIKKKDIPKYLNEYNPIQLRDTRKTIVNELFEVMNFGESKGLSFQRVLIYPTKPIIEWLKDHQSDLKATSRSKLYVAITRARQSVAFACDENIGSDTIQKYYTD